VEVTDDPSEDYDVIDINTVGPTSMYHLKKAQRAGKPAIAHAHTTGEDFKNSFRGSNVVAPLVRKYVKTFYNRADRVIVPSEYTRRRVADYPLKPPVHVVSNGVDMDRLEGYDELRDEYRSRYHLEGLVVFVVGHVFERKGLSTFCQLAQELPDMDFVWFGPIMDNPLGSSEVKKWVNDPPENVQFTGFIEDIRGGFGAGDVFLFPTKEENQGIAVLEAMACQKGVVVSDLPVFDEYLDNGENCFMCSEFGEYKEALETFRDDDMREEFGEKAGEAAEKHSLENVGKELIEVYEEALD
ncbi:MAG: glycosyltransferase, partial [Halobacteria archaeon]|nr:glycosyltransferase [Halobacteria archaeon]